MDMQEALTVAIQFEHKVRDHYAKCAKKVEDPQGHKVFATLAREEQGHVEYLEARLAELRTRGAVTAAELPTVLPPADRIQAAARKLAGKPAAAPSGLPELDYLKQALDLERETSAFYQDLAAKLPAQDRAPFAPFLDIEDGHLALVQAEIDALVGHGHWFDIMEFSLEQG